MSGASAKQGGASKRGWIIGPPMLWLGLFFLLPFAMVARISLSDAALARPPYRPAFDGSQGFFGGIYEVVAGLDFENYLMLLSEPLFLDALWTSLRMASSATLILLLIGYPMALAMARAPQRWRPILLGLVILPFWTSFLIRVYAWIGILKPEGFLTNTLQAIGLIGEPLQIINTPIAVLIGIVYAYLPFMVLPLYASLAKLDPALIEAAQDLGCSPMRAFWRVTLPLTRAGAIAGSLLVFIPAMGEFVIPDLLGGSDTLMLGRAIWTEFFSNRDWPLASAIAIVLLLLLIGPILAYREVEMRQLEANR
ncbi:MAG: ABC transporter permease [Bosea sp. (in: a-proteobacteria)]